MLNLLEFRFCVLILLYSHVRTYIPKLWVRADLLVWVGSGCFSFMTGALYLAICLLCLLITYPPDCLLGLPFSLRSGQWLSV